METARFVLQQLPHPVRITLIGGEPCLWLLKHPHFIEEIFRGGHSAHLITNGILLPRLPSVVDAFRDRPLSAQFSIDGMHENYQAIRKGSSWEALVSALRLVQSRRREGNNRKVVLSANYLLMKRTYSQLEEFIRFCATEGVDFVTLTYAIIYESMVQRGTISEQDSMLYSRDLARQAIEKARLVACDQGISLLCPPDPELGFAARSWSGPPLASVASGKFTGPPSVACTKPWKEIFVDQSGVVTPCCCGTGQAPVLGPIDSGLQTLWNGEKAKAIRSEFIQKQFPDECRCGINISAVGREDSPSRFFIPVATLAPRK